MARAVALSIYVVILAAGAWVVSRRALGAWVTTHALTVNQQLDSGDVRWARGVGGPATVPITESPLRLHVTGPKRAGAPLTRADVRPFPVWSPSGAAHVWTIRPKRQPELLRPGVLRSRDRLGACVPGPPSGEGDSCVTETVVAVHRAVETSDSSFLILAMAPARLVWLERFLGAEGRGFFVVER